MAKQQGVYVVGSREYGWVKIGMTTDFEQRRSALQAGCPFILETLRWYKSLLPKSLEQQLHSKFEGHRLHAEWFHFKDLPDFFSRADQEVKSFSQRYKTELERKQAEMKAAKGKTASDLRWAEKMKPFTGGKIVAKGWQGY